MSGDWNDSKKEKKSFLAFLLMLQAIAKRLKALAILMVISGILVVNTHLTSFPLINGFIDLVKTCKLTSNNIERGMVEGGGVGSGFGGREVIKGIKMEIHNPLASSVVLMFATPSFHFAGYHNLTHRR